MGITLFYYIQQNQLVRLLNMENVLLTIEKKIWESIDNEERIGLFNGLSGIALFYDYLFLHDNREEYKEKLNNLT